MVPGAERKLREQRGVSSEYLIRAHQKSPGPPQTRGFNQPTKSVLGTIRMIYLNILIILNGKNV